VRFSPGLVPILRDLGHTAPPPSPFLSSSGMGPNSPHFSEGGFDRGFAVADVLLCAFQKDFGLSLFVFDRFLCPRSWSFGSHSRGGRLRRKILSGRIPHTPGQVGLSFLSTPPELYFHLF